MPGDRARSDELTSVRSAAPQRLTRGLGARLFSGMLFQPYLTFAVALGPAILILTAVISLSSHTSYPFDGSDALSFLVMVPYGAIWLLGVTARAQVDETGVSWRYYRPRAFRWEEIDEIEFGGTLLAAGQTPLRQPAIFVIVAGHRHKVAPAVGVSRRHLSEFSRVLGLEAGRHGVGLGGSRIDFTGVTGQVQ